MHHCQPMNCFLGIKNKIVHKATQHGFPKSLQRSHSHVIALLWGLKTIVGVPGEPTGECCGIVARLQARGKNNRNSSLLASPFFLLLAF